MTSSSAPTILCVGLAVQDILFRVDSFPPPGSKAMTHESMTVCGGNAANAAIAVARLGGRTSYCGPLGGENDPASRQVIDTMQREGIDMSGIVRMADAGIPISAIMIDATGERMIVTYRDRRIENARVPDAGALVSGVALVLADNRFPEFVLPVCEAARKRNIPIVLDADRPTRPDDPLFAIPSHVVFSAECLRATTGEQDLDAGLKAMEPRTRAFLAVSDGPGPLRYIRDGSLQNIPAFEIAATDTLAAGDVFHGGFALALAEGCDEPAALRFGAAAAALKCTRFGGSMGAPVRADVERFLRSA